MPAPLRSPLHLRLTIRQQRGGLFRLRGNHEAKIGQRHKSGLEAVRSIRAYCRVQRCTALVRIYQPAARLWREDHVQADGSVQSVYASGGTLLEVIETE